MNWGKSIILVFICFAMFIGVLVTVCIRQNISLVSKNYYNEELNYQSEIEEMNNVASLTERPIIFVQQKQIAIAGIERGELKLMRPSDPHYDALFQIDSLKTFDLSKYPAGKYNASLRWEMNGKMYLIRESINL